QALIDLRPIGAARCDVREQTLETLTHCSFICERLAHTSMAPAFLKPPGSGALPGFQTNASTRLADEGLSAGEVAIGHPAEEALGRPRRERRDREGRKVHESGIPGMRRLAAVRVRVDGAVHRVQDTGVRIPP